MAISDITELGRQGLTANRQALQTTANNIANANTPGFTRRKAMLGTNQQSTNGGAIVGGGVEVKKVIRVHDAFIQNQIMEEARNFGATKMRSDGLRHAERIVNNESFKVGDLMNNFFNGFRELSATPESSTLRNAAIQNADAAAQGFRHLNRQLCDLKANLDTRIGIAIDEVNTMTEELSKLNANIASFNAVQEAPHELYDRRETVLRQLSEKLGLEVGTDEQDNANLSAGGLGNIVNRGEACKLVVVRTAAHDEKGPGSFDIILKDPFGNRTVTKSIKDGEIGGLIHVRDQVINPAIDHLDKVAYEFAQKVNEVHRQGKGLDGQGERDHYKTRDAPSAASTYHELRDAINKSPDVLASGMNLNSPSDNQIALEIADVQSQALLPDNLRGGGGPEGTKHQTLNESLNSMIGNIAIQTNHEDAMFHHQEAIMKQLENYRESVSGVNMEEEAINMMQYQTVFNASAKVMKIGDELFQTILRIKD